MSLTNPPYHETINKILYGILQHFEGNPVPMNIPRPPYYNVTNELLYAILNKLGSREIPVIYTGIRVLYVSSRYGDDLTAEVNSEKKPYKTITAAKNNYFFGDIIHVMEGIYNEGSLSGNYFYWFDFGAEVVYTGNTGAIFHQRFGECIVRGYGKFKCTGDANVINVGNWLNCVLDIECESIESVRKAIILWQNRANGDPVFYKPHRIKARRAYSSTQAAVHYHFNVHADVEIDEIISDSVDQQTVLGNNIKKASLKNSIVISNNNSVIMWNANVNSDMVIEHCEIISNFNSPNGHGLILIFWGSNSSIYNTRINVKHPDAKSIHADFFFNLKIDNNVIANRDTGGTFPINYINKGNKIILENNEVTIDITGSASINLSACSNADVIRVTSMNPEETLNAITAAPRHHSFKLVPDAGLLLKFNSVDPNAATDTSIVLQEKNLKLNGDKGDWVELHNGLHGIGNRQINASTY